MDDIWKNPKNFNKIYLFLLLHEEISKKILTFRSSNDCNNVPAKPKFPALILWVIAILSQISTCCGWSVISDKNLVLQANSSLEIPTLFIPIKILSANL